MHSKSHELLERERQATKASLFVVGLFLLAGWLVWGWLGRVGIYESSESAWIEQTPAPARVEVASGGPIVRIGEKFFLGAEVKAGDILVEIDGTSERALLAAKRSEHESIPRQVEIAEEKKRQLQELSELVLKQSKTQRRQAQATLAAQRAQMRAVTEEAKRLAEISNSGISQMELLKKSADARAKQFDVAALAEGVKGSDLVGQRDSIEAQMRISELETAIANLIVKRDTLAAEIAQLEAELGRKVVMATQSGVLVKTASLREGAVVQVGDPVGTIVSQGGLKIVAQFSGGALSRLRMGQRGSIEIDRFPRLIFGTRACQVASISTELENGLARVELAPQGKVLNDVPFQHGMLGKVEVEVERISPLMLALRTAGWALDETARTPTSIQQDPAQL